MDAVNTVGRTAKQPFPIFAYHLSAMSYLLSCVDTVGVWAKPV